MDLKINATDDSMLALLEAVSETSFEGETHEGGDGREFFGAL